MHTEPSAALPGQPVHGWRCGQKGGMGQPSARSAVGVSHRKMWFDLLVAGVTGEKIEQQPNAVFLELWNVPIVHRKAALPDQ